MNDLASLDRQHVPDAEHETEEQLKEHSGKRRRWGGRVFGLGVFLVLIGALYLGPNGEKVGKLFATEGPTSVAARAGLDKIFLVTRLQLVLLAFVVFLMVAKP